MPAVGIAMLAVGVASLASWQYERATGQLAQSQDPLACQSGLGLPVDFPEQRHAGMVAIPGGSFIMGTRHGYPDEMPAGSVTIRPFWMDRHEVTNAQYAAFVAATGYRTQAELEGGAAVFRAPEAESAPPGGRAPTWWIWVDGASWQSPEGSGSNLQDRAHHPVVHVTYADAMAYAQWLGRDLPTEAEWEWAARANGEPERIEWEPRNPAGEPTANFWQGVFPVVNTIEDGFDGRAPVTCFPANGWGLYDMIGNVWEWTTDPYQGPHQPHGHGSPAPAARAALARLPAAEVLVIKGGSYLCADNYCSRYRSTARHPQEHNLPTSHVGFRTVLRSNP